MDRRWIGVLVVILGLTGALVGAARTKAIPGASRPATLIGAPQVGDCLLAPLPAPAGRPTTTLDTGPCADGRYGEVVGVFAAIPPVAAGPEPGTYDSVCRPAENRYLGQASEPDQSPGPVAEYWYPLLPLDRAVLAPAEPDQRWIACAVGTRRPADGSAPARYAGSIRLAFAGGLLPARFASCPDTTILRAESSCDQPHHTEFLGYTRPLTSPPSRAALLATCRQLAELMTGLPDPTVPPLQLELAPFSTGIDPTGGDTVMYACRIHVQNGRQLTGPLVGLGSGPLPVN